MQALGRETERYRNGRERGELVKAGDRGVIAHTDITRATPPDPTVETGAVSKLVVIPGAGGAVAVTTKTLTINGNVFLDGNLTALVTGLGLVTPLGTGLEATYAWLVASRQAIA